MADQLPFNYPIVILAGHSWNEVFYILDDDGDSALRAGCIIALVVLSALDGSVLLSLTTASGKLVMDVDAGSVKPNTVPSDTASMTNIPALYTMTVLYPNGSDLIPFAGKASIRAGV